MPPKKTTSSNKRINSGTDDNTKHSKKARTSSSSSSSPSPPAVETTIIELSESPKHEECNGACSHCGTTFAPQERGLWFCEDCCEDTCRECHSKVWFHGKKCPIHEKFLEEDKEAASASAINMPEDLDSDFVCPHCQASSREDEYTCFCEHCENHICGECVTEACCGLKCPIVENSSKEESEETDVRGCTVCGSSYEREAVEKDKQNYYNMQKCDHCQQYYCAYSDSCGGVDHDHGSICFDCGENMADVDERCAICGTTEDGDEHYCVGCDSRVCTKCYHPKLNDCITCVKKSKSKSKSKGKTSDLESSVEDGNDSD